MASVIIPDDSIFHAEWCINNPTDIRICADSLQLVWNHMLDSALVICIAGDYFMLEPRKDTAQITTVRLNEFMSSRCRYGEGVPCGS